MSRLDDLLGSHPLPTWRQTAWPVIILIAVLIVWANIYKRDEYSVASGEVVPQGGGKIVQHLEGGIIEQIFVQEGDTVVAEQPLLQLNLATSGVNREELQVRLDSQILLRARLEAETGGKALVFPVDASLRLPSQVIAQQQAFAARQRELEKTLGVQGEQMIQKEQQVKELAAKKRSLELRMLELNSSAGVLHQQINQKELEVKELEARSRAVGKNLGLAKERFEMSKKLLADKLVPEMEHLELKAEVESLEGEAQGLSPAVRRARSAVAESVRRLKEEVDSVTAEMEGLAPSIPRTQAAVAEAKARIEETEIRFRREAQDELGKTEQAIDRIQSLFNEATDQKQRSEIKSPIEGVVKNLRYNTIGGIVGPGEPILEIVPTTENLVIEAKLSPIDRGYVETGQKATVKISTYDFVRYGGLDAKVIIVAPDTSIDERMGPYFKVTVRTEKNFLGEVEGDLPITPGMQATVDIHTGRKSFMDYLIKPVLKLRHEAFRER